MTQSKKRYLNAKEYQFWQSNNPLHQAWVASLKAKFSTIIWQPKNTKVRIEVVLYNTDLIERPEYYSR